MLVPVPPVQITFLVKSEKRLGRLQVAPYYTSLLCATNRNKITIKAYQVV